jgi:hypothetical protein
LPLGAWGAPEAVPKLSEAQEAFLREYRQHHDKVKRLCEKIKAKVQERDALMAEQGEQANVTSKNKLSRREATLSYMLYLSSMHSIAPCPRKFRSYTDLQLETS